MNKKTIERVIILLEASIDDEMPNWLADNITSVAIEMLRDLKTK